VGKQKTLALGVYPTVTPAAARNGRDAARKHLAAAMGPSIKRKIDKQSAANTFRLIGEESLDNFDRSGRAPATLVKLRWLLDLAFESLGDRPVAEIAALQKSCLRCVGSKDVANTRRHAVCAVRAAWFSATRLQRHKPNATRLPI
jgi:hypothetical protein